MTARRERSIAEVFPNSWERNWSLIPHAPDSVVIRYEELTKGENVCAQSR
jgi:hypothetical protein